MQTYLPVASKLCTIPLCTSFLMCIRQEGSKCKLKKYGKLRESKLGALWNNLLARIGCFCIKTFRGGLNEKPQLSHNLECFAPELENAIFPSHLFCVPGIMTRALAAIDDTVTGNIWWFPINNLDGLGSSLELEGAARQQKKRKRKWEAKIGRRENWRRERKASMKWIWILLPDPPTTGSLCNQIHWQSVPETP